MQTLAEITAHLRTAVESHNYDEARGLMPSYCQLLEAEFRSHPPSSPEARRIAEDAKELYQSLARSVVFDRTQYVMELQRLANLSAYLKPRGPAPHTCELEG